jgi:hypothetical protein
MKKIKSFLTVFLVALLFISSASFSTIKAENGNNEGTNQEGQNVESEPKEIKTYEVHYVAIAAYYVDQFDVPEEVVELMPADHTAITNEVVDPKQPSATSVGSWTFTGYEPGWAVVTDEDLWFYGVWVDSEATEDDTSASGMRREATITSGFGGGWSLRDNTGGDYYTGTHEFLLNGEEAYCIDIDRMVPNAGTAYTSSGTDNGRVAGIIMMGEKNNMSHAAIQATVWNYLHTQKGTSHRFTAGGENVDYTSSAYDDSNYNCYINTYEPNVSAQTFATSGGYSLKSGSLKVKKKAAEGFNYTKNCSANYSLKGAVYGVYTDQNCTNLKGTLTTKADGSTNAMTITTAGTYYVKEITASPGFMLDTAVHSVSVSLGSTTTVTSTETPYKDPTYITLKKKSSNDNGYVDYLDTAEFTVKYYNVTPDTTNLTGKIPVYTWVFKSEFEANPTNPDEKMAVVRFNKDYLISGDETLFTDDGLKIPLGVFTIEETKAPQTYARDENIYMGKAEIENNRIKITIQGGNHLEVQQTQLEQLEDVLILKTTAIFEENNSDRYFADGYVHINDIVEYENLEEGKYYQLVGQLVEKEVDVETLYTQVDFDAGNCTEDQIGTRKSVTYKEGSVIQTSSTIFSPGIDLNPAEPEEDEDASTTNPDTTDPDATGNTGTGTGNTGTDPVNPTEPQEPEEEQVAGKGEATVQFYLDVDNYGGKDFVVYETLYEVSVQETETTDGTKEPLIVENEETGKKEYVLDETKQTKKLTYHEDLNDEGQTVHVDPLYKADFILYKNSNFSKNHKLNGAYFHVTTKRTKRDGRVVEQDLGNFVTGAIYYEADPETEFVVEVSSDIKYFEDGDNYVMPDPIVDEETGEETPAVTIKSYTSKYNKKLDKNVVAATDLEDGIYYAKTTIPTEDGKEQEVEKWYVSKGMIYLPKQAEDTEISFVELIAPAGYYLDSKTYTYSVGHDYTLERVENYRTNIFIVIPQTGIDG